MKLATYGNFHVGIVNDPSIEDKGGFEFSAGMDIFSEPGVLKACNKMVEASYGAGAQPTATPVDMVDVDFGGTKAYMIAGAKLLEATSESSWTLFKTNTQGNNLGVGVWAGYVLYAAATALGRAIVNNPGSAVDTFDTIDSDTDYHPMTPQGGTLKIGAGRYVSSVDEAFIVTNQVLKLPVGYRMMTLADHFGQLFAGTRRGDSNVITAQDAAVFGWRGVILSTGSALPDTAYPLKLRGMNAILSDGNNLYGFADELFQILAFDGATFKEFRSIRRLLQSLSLRVGRGAVAQHLDTLLFSGATSLPQVYQMKNGAIAGAFVPSFATPGATASYDIGVVKSSFNGKVIIGYKNAGNSTYHIEYSHATHKQDNAVVRTLWHRFGTDKLKRGIGVKLNLKPMPANTAVTVAYRTSRDAAFTNAPYTITASNQDKPVIFSAQPRSREIQYQFTYTTNTSSTPELLSYDPLYEILNSNR